MRCLYIYIHASMKIPFSYSSSTKTEEQPNMIRIRNEMKWTVLSFLLAMRHQDKLWLNQMLTQTIQNQPSNKRMNERKRANENLIYMDVCVCVCYFWRKRAENEFLYWTLVNLTRNVIVENYHYRAGENVNERSHLPVRWIKRGGRDRGLVEEKWLAFWRNGKCVFFSLCMYMRWLFKHSTYKC